MALVLNNFLLLRHLCAIVAALLMQNWMGVAFPGDPEMFRLYRHLFAHPCVHINPGHHLHMQVTLNRYDLFHAHLFLAGHSSDWCSCSSNNSRDWCSCSSNNSRDWCSCSSNNSRDWCSCSSNNSRDWRSCSSNDSSRGAQAWHPRGGSGGDGDDINTAAYSLGLLFHCKEFPAYNEECFPYLLGYCQVSPWQSLSALCMCMRVLESNLRSRPGACRKPQLNANQAWTCSMHLAAVNYCESLCNQLPGSIAN